MVARALCQLGVIGFACFLSGEVAAKPPPAAVHAHYVVLGQAPGTAVVSVVVTENTKIGSGPTIFNMVDFVENHSAVVDGSGEVRVSVGATLETTGNGMPYGDSLYMG